MFVYACTHACVLMVECLNDENHGATLQATADLLRPWWITRASQSRLRSRLPYCGASKAWLSRHKAWLSRGSAWPVESLSSDAWDCWHRDKQGGLPLFCYEFRASCACRSATLTGSFLLVWAVFHQRRSQTCFIKTLIG